MVKIVLFIMAWEIKKAVIFSIEKIESSYGYLENSPWFILKNQNY